MPCVALALRVVRSGDEYISISTLVITGSYGFYRTQVGTDVRLVIIYVCDLFNYFWDVSWC